MPLIWAHAELIKLIYIHISQKPIERFNCVEDRYLKNNQKSDIVYWYDTIACGSVSSQYQLCIQASSPFNLHYGLDGWNNIQNQSSRPLGLRMHGVCLNLKDFVGKKINFTRHFDDKGWEGRNWDISIV